MQGPLRDSEYRAICRFRDTARARSGGLVRELWPGRSNRHLLMKNPIYQRRSESNRCVISMFERREAAGKVCLGCCCAWNVHLGREGKGTGRVGQGWAGRQAFAENRGTGWRAPTAGKHVKESCEAGRRCLSLRARPPPIYATARAAVAA